MSAASVRAVVFDIGGVLLDWDPRHLYRKLIADPDELDHFLSTICTPEWHAEQDLGKDIRSACDELALLYPGYRDLINAWAERNEDMIAGAIPGSPEVLAELRSSGVPCYCLSNMEPEAFERRRERFPFLDDFDGCVISATNASQNRIRGSSSASSRATS